MKQIKVVCTHCKKEFYIEKGSSIPEYCDECIQRLKDEELDKVYSSSVINATIDETLTKNFKKREEFRSLIDYSIYFALMSGASDLHLKAGLAPIIRKGGILFDFTEEILESDEIYEFTRKNNFLLKDKDETIKSYDFAIEEGGKRFRCNTYHDAKGWCTSLRIINKVNTDFVSLGIPEVLKEMVKNQSGLILLTGPTGSGKSTTMSALVEYLNETERKHIITIEDPIEFVYPKGKCLITQREIGRDVRSYDEAIVEALREDPDILLIGEMRDMESIEAALRAVETGHIVISTLHTRGSASTINRIIDVFPPEKQSQVRTQLALNLTCCVTQQLVPSIVPGELALATEVMIANDAIRASIRDNKLHFINLTVELGQNVGMHTMKQDLERLKKEGRISLSSFEKYQIK